MRTYFLDAETYYDKLYSLRKMTPVEYVLDPRFEAIGCAVKEGWPGGSKSYWVEGTDLKYFFGSLKSEETIVVSHNMLFDGCIFAWRYGFVPRLLSCTMSIAKACRGHLLRSVALRSVAEHLELGHKGSALNDVIGMGLGAIKAVPALYRSFTEYAINDVELCAGIFDKLVRGGEYPMRELPVLDMVLRCAINPKFRLDAHALQNHLNTVQADKEVLLAKAAFAGCGGEQELASNEQFAKLLRELGVYPGMKISKTTGHPTYAFAKTDRFMVELEQHENPMVQVLAAARIGTKSTLEEKRTERLLSIANLSWPDGDNAKMPIPLRCPGAHTHRLSGDWKLNMQNLPRKSPIRRALIVPPGHSVVTADAAQIEARGVAAVCGQMDLVRQFENGEDVYASFASDAFGKTITKKDNPGERFIGKVNILQLGYQSGWRTLQQAIRVQSKSQLGQEMQPSDEDCQKWVKVYRARYDRIVAAWNLLNTTGIDVLAHGGSNFRFGPCVFEKGSILLPSGLRLFYHDLQFKPDQGQQGEWCFTYGGKPEKLYGGKLLENIIQALSRIITMDAGVRIQKKFELALQVHDELGYVVPDEHVDTLKVILQKEMTKRPEWCSWWPLSVEISGPAKSYGECK